MSEYVLGNNISQTETVQLQQQPRWHHNFRLGNLNESGQTDVE